MKRWMLSLSYFVGLLIILGFWSGVAAANVNIKEFVDAQQTVDRVLQNKPAYLWAGTMTYNQGGTRHTVEFVARFVTFGTVLRWQFELMSYKLDGQELAGGPDQPYPGFEWRGPSTDVNATAVAVDENYEPVFCGFLRIKEWKAGMPFIFTMHPLVNGQLIPSRYLVPDALTPAFPSLGYLDPNPGNFSWMAVRFENGVQMIPLSNGSWEIHEPVGFNTVVVQGKRLCPATVYFADRLSGSITVYFSDFVGRVMIKGTKSDGTTKIIVYDSKDRNRHSVTLSPDLVKAGVFFIYTKTPVKSLPPFYVSFGQ